MPSPVALIRSDVPPSRPDVEWPAGCPPRPIKIHQLYNTGVYAEILRDVDMVVQQCHASHRGDRTARIEGTAYPPDTCMPEWARHVDWDASNPDDVPLQPSREPPDQGANPEFFRQWADKLDWADKEMVHNVTCTGAQDGSHACSRATIINGHHSGLRSNFEAAKASIDADAAVGFITAGRRHLRYVPCICVSKNCVRRRQWKLVHDDLIRSVKWRVSTDDSISTKGETSRNQGMDQAEWSKPGLPSPRTLAEAVAIVKSCSEAMSLDITEFESERVALWAFDLTHAYRELAVDKADRRKQCFVWLDGIRSDLRCVFGDAHMVDYFQRVTTFVLAVGRHRIVEYERQHPFSANREKWRRWRRDECGIHGGVGYSTIYLDDGLGCTVLGKGKPLKALRKHAVASQSVSLSRSRRSSR